MRREFVRMVLVRSAQVPLLWAWFLIDAALEALESAS